MAQDEKLFSIEINRIYNFTFEDPFTALNGVYKVTGILNYKSLIDSNIDIKTMLYDPLGIDTSIFNSHLEKFPNTTFLKLEKLGDEPVIYYVPDFIISGHPDYNIVKCYRMGIAIDLGYFTSADELINIQNAIKDFLKTYYGLDPSEVNTNLFVISEHYLSEEDWNTIKANRQSLKQQYSLYSQNNKLIYENDGLRTKMSEYENLLIDLNE